MTSTTRRHFLAAGISVAATAMVPVPAPAVPALRVDPDAALLQLVDEYFAAHSEEKRLLAAVGPHEARWWALRSEREEKIPAALYVRSEDSELWIDLPVTYYGDREIDRLRGEIWSLVEGTNDKATGIITVTSRRFTPSPEARARADEIVAAFDKWKKACERRPTGYRAAERAYKAAVNITCRIENEIVHTPARTLAGITGKARMVKAGDISIDDVMAQSIARDLLALADASSVTL